MPKKTKSKSAIKSVSAPKSRPATIADADIMLRTYEQRRRQVLRDALRRDRGRHVPQLGCGRHDLAELH